MIVSEFFDINNEILNSIKMDLDSNYEVIKNSHKKPGEFAFWCYHFNKKHNCFLNINGGDFEFEITIKKNNKQFILFFVNNTYNKYYFKNMSLIREENDKIENILISKNFFSYSKEEKFNYQTFVLNKKGFYIQYNDKCIYEKKSIDTNINKKLIEYLYDSKNHSDFFEHSQLLYDVVFDKEKIDLCVFDKDLFSI